MDVTHETMLELSKVWGLLYLILFSIGVVVYTFWPSNRARFDRAETEIFDNDDTPWR
ncbi:cbb3-type cytochrome c oxidase subunit 3 [Rhizobium ruizarguesonis]